MEITPTSVIRVFVDGNYFIIEDTNTGQREQDLRKDVHIHQSEATTVLGDDPSYTIAGPNLYNFQVNLSQIVDESGNGFTTSEWTTFYTENTGNFSTAGGGSPAGGAPVGGSQSFVADGVANSLSIPHGAGFTPDFWSLTTSTPQTLTHLSRTVTFPDDNTMLITFGSTPIVGEDVTYVYVLFPPSTP